MAKEITTNQYSDVLLHPRVTEKAALLAEHNVYTFEISSRSNKKDVTCAIKELYKVTPVKVNIARGAVKNVRRKGRPGVRKGNKRAMVFLKKGDKIEFV